MFVHSVFIEACDSHLSMATLNKIPIEWESSIGDNVNQLKTELV
jgi:hypothetical protein